MGSVGSEPTKKRVVLKFSKDMRKATAQAPMIAGRRNLNVICQIGGIFLYQSPKVLQYLQLEIVPWEDLCNPLVFSSWSNSLCAFLYCLFSALIFSRLGLRLGLLI